MDPLKAKALASAGLGLAALLAGWLYLRAREAQLLKRGEMVELVVAGRHIPAGARLERGWLARRSVPREYAPRGAVLDPSDAAGQLSLVPFNAQEPLLFNKLAQGGPSLSATVPEGRRAFTLPVDQISGLAGMLRQGDLVDVLFMAEAKAAPVASASTLLQGARVLAAGGEAVPGEARPSGEGSVTLALTPMEAELALFAMARGALHLSLRPPGDSRLLPLGPVTQGDLNARTARAWQAAGLEP